MLSCWVEGCFRGECSEIPFMSCLKVREDRTSPLVFFALLNLHNVLEFYVAYGCLLGIFYLFILRVL